VGPYKLQYVFNHYLLLLPGWIGSDAHGYAIKKCVSYHSTSGSAIPCTNCAIIEFIS
jgi:hypothetical protein